MPSRKESSIKPTVTVRRKRPTAPTVPAPPQSMTPRPATPQPVTPKPVPPQPPTVTPPPQPQASVHQQPPPSVSPPPPDQPTRKQREAHARSELLAVLRERWPQTFPADFRQVKPFALGIHQEILRALPDTNPYLLRRAIHFYQRGGKGAYWRAILEGGSRYTLDGTPNGEVTAQDKEHATQELARVTAWWKAKREGRSQATAQHDRHANGQTEVEEKSGQAKRMPSQHPAQRANGEQ
jgi:sRNA-binding protein